MGTTRMSVVSNALQIYLQRVPLIWILLQAFILCIAYAVLCIGMCKGPIIIYTYIKKKTLYAYTAEQCSWHWMASTAARFSFKIRIFQIRVYIYTTYIRKLHNIHMCWYAFVELSIFWRSVFSYFLYTQIRLHSPYKYNSIGYIIYFVYIFHVLYIMTISL